MQKKTKKQVDTLIKKVFNWFVKILEGKPVPKYLSGKK